jgi:hypothetical protein
MTIDIINYSDAQLAALSAEKVLEIREAQLKKNKLSAQLETRLKEEKQRLIERGAYPSTIWNKIVTAWTAEYERQVEILRESLVFFLHYAADDAPNVYPDAPYTVDYSLSAEERLAIVKNYYETEYEDEYKRYNAFKNDAFAKVYLGELYSPLHDYFYRAS